MTNGRGRQRFLTKARDQHRIVADQVRQDDLDCMLGLQKDVPRLENDAHAAAPEAFLELITAVEDRFAADRRSRL